MSITDVDGTVKEALDVHRRVGERAVVFFDAVMAILNSHSKRNTTEWKTSYGVR